jgi:cobalamin biosynthesis Mg chelatase CobN
MCHIAVPTDIKCLLAKNTNEITSIVRALRGEYIKPGVGGDLLRDVSSY